MATVVEGPPSVAQGHQLNILKTQVGGHSLILEVDRDWICKPVDSREAYFYQNMPEALKPFTPTYQGFLSVSFNYNEHGCSGSELRKDISSTLPDKNGHLTRDVSNDGNLEVSELARSTETTLCMGKVTNISCEDFDNISGHLPWTTRANNKKLNCQSQTDDVSTGHDSHIVLENLTGKFRRPCVMDLKLGTRSYSDSMSYEKKQIHLSKCSSSTSELLGVRLCGMQLYSEESNGGRYHLMDKYYGRSLDKEGFLNVLKDFFCKTNSGNRVEHLLSLLIRKLEQLREVVRQLEGYRFYSSSLLIFYEGHQRTSDFHHHDTSTTRNSQCSHRQEKSCSEEYHPTTNGLRVEHEKPVLGIRVIDFGNVTCKHFASDPVAYTGPDDGFIKGLTTIIDYYKTLF